MSKLGVRKGAWEKAEDILLRKCIKKYGEGNWHQVPQRAGLNRCRKSCRLRWLNYLRPNIKRGEFKEDEIDLIIRLHKLLGNRWSLIAGRLPGRTANDIKNYWNSHLSKKFVFKEKDEGIPNLQKVEVIKPQPRSFKVMPTRLTNKHVKQQEQHVHQQLQQQQLLLPQQQQQQLLPQQGEHDMPEEHGMPEPLEEGSMWWENLVLDSEEINQDLRASFRNHGLSSSIGEDVEPMGAEEGMVVDGGGVEFDDLVNMNFWILE